MLGRGPARRAGDAPGRLWDGGALRHPQPSRRARAMDPPELLLRSSKGGGRVRGMLPAPLEESAWTARPQRVRNRLGIGLLVALSAAGISACGGGERQDVNEPSGDFPVQIVSADFPSKQKLAENTNLTLSVANTGEQDDPRPGDHDLHHLECEHERNSDFDHQYKQLDGHVEPGPAPVAGLILGPLRRARPRHSLPAGLDPRGGLSEARRPDGLCRRRGCAD